jgi:hypothetical protein
LLHINEQQELLLGKEVMDALISISSNWQAWAVWIGFVMLLIGLMHYFNGLVKEELCEICEQWDADHKWWIEEINKHVWLCWNCDAACDREMIINMWAEGEGFDPSTNTNNSPAA